MYEFLSSLEACFSLRFRNSNKLLCLPLLLKELEVLKELVCNPKCRCLLGLTVTETPRRALLFTSANHVFTKLVSHCELQRTGLSPR